MSTEQAGAVVIQVTAEDFERLCENAGRWADCAPQAGRFEGDTDGGPPSSRPWRRIYWMGDAWASVILARAFLAARGYEYEIVFDTLAGGGPPFFAWAILTDYEEE